MQSQPCVVPLILSGGSGSRLWPLSRGSLPKQFLSLHGEHAMIAATALRVKAGDVFASPLVISNADHRFLIMDALEQVGCPPAQVLLEPCGRNTAPAVLAGALYAAQQNPEALVLAMPSDHVVKHEEGFAAAIRQALPAAQAGYIITFSTVASRPETGYGYIQAGGALEVGKGLFHIQRFCEKPDLATAQRYVESGEYSWNMGIFLFKASALIAEMEALCPELCAGVRASLAKAREDIGFIRLGAEAFAAVPSVPFDIAVMEKTSKGAVVPVEVGWSDVGSWHSLWEVMCKDARGNAGRRDAQFFDSSDCLAWSAPGMFTAVVGLENVAVVTTDDAVLVMDKNNSEQVREVVDFLKTERRSEHLLASKIYRPWGSYQHIDEGKGYRVKRLEVRPGARLSLQYHNHRAEHWTVVEGVATVTRGDAIFELQANASAYIAMGVTHRLENQQATPLVLIEVQTGEYLEEDDIVRLEDNYGRA